MKGKEGGKNEGKRVGGKAHESTIENLSDFGTPVIQVLFGGLSTCGGPPFLFRVADTDFLTSGISKTVPFSNFSAIFSDFLVEAVSYISPIFSYFGPEARNLFCSRPMGPQS